MDDFRHEVDDVFEQLARRLLAGRPTHRVQWQCGICGRVETIDAFRPLPDPEVKAALDEYWARHHDCYAVPRESWHIAARPFVLLGEPSPGVQLWAYDNDIDRWVWDDDAGRWVEAELALTSR